MTVTHPSSRPPRRTARVRGMPVARRDRMNDGSAAVASPFVLGLLAGLQAAAAGLLLVTAVAAVLWVASPGGAASALDLVRTSAIIWLVGFRTGLSTSTGFVHLAPLGFTMMLGMCAWWFARRAGRALAIGGSTHGRAARTQAGFVLAHVVAGMVVALLCPTPQVRPQVETAVPGLALFAALVSTGPLWQHRIVSSWRRRASSRVGAWLRAGSSALAFPAAVAMLLIAGCVVHGFSRVSSLYDALHPGPVGSLGLALVHLGALPNVVVWLLSWFAGPGFAVGVGTTVSSSETVLGPLPAVPLFGILPSPGDQPGWLVGAAILVVVIGGALAGRCLTRWHAESQTTLRDRLLDVLAAAAIAGLSAAGLAWWTSGSLGGGVMASWGIGSWVFPFALSAEVAAGLAITVLAEPALRRVKLRRRSAAGPS